MESSLLNKLPAELRLDIYELALAHTSPIVVVVTADGYKSVGTERPHLSALLQTCKQINQEAAPILYGSNNISLSCSDVADINQAATDFFKHIGPLNTAVTKALVVCPHGLRFNLFPRRACRIDITRDRAAEMIDDLEWIAAGVRVDNINAVRVGFDVSIGTRVFATNFPCANPGEYYRDLAKEIKQHRLSLQRPGKKSTLFDFQYEISLIEYTFLASWQAHLGIQWPKVLEPSGVPLEDRLRALGFGGL